MSGQFQSIDSLRHHLFRQFQFIDNARNLLFTQLQIIDGLRNPLSGQFQLIDNRRNQLQTHQSIKKGIIQGVTYIHIYYVCHCRWPALAFPVNIAHFHSS